ncbi:hypothetical protein [Archaeoglobus sp.]
MLRHLVYLFNLPYQKERHILEVLEEVKKPTIILLGEIRGWWRRDGDVIRVTDGAIDYLKNLYAYWIKRYWIELKKLDPAMAERVLYDLLKQEPVKT